MDCYLLSLYKPNNILNSVLVKTLMLARKKKATQLGSRQKEREAGSECIEKNLECSPNPGQKGHQVSPRPET